MYITAKRRMLLCFILLFILFTLHATAGRVFAALVEFKYDYGRMARLGVWGIPNELEAISTTLPAKDLRLEIYPESARDEQPDFTGGPIASQDVRSSAGMAGIANKATSLTFDSDPGVYYFKLSYKLPASADIDYKATVAGPFTVSDVQEGAQNAQKVYLSSITLAAAPQIRDPEKSGYVIEAWDYLGNPMTPTGIVVTSADYPEGGDFIHQYTVAVSVASLGPYRYVVTPLDDDFGVVEGSISCTPAQLTDAILRNAFFGYNSLLPVGNTVTVTYRVTKGAGLSVHKKSTTHFTPFTVYSVPLTEEEDEGYDVYRGEVPYASITDFGGKGTKFLRQVGGLDLSRSISKITVTLNAETMDRDYRNPYEDNHRFYDDVYFNVNDAQHLVLPAGESRRVMPIRVWQAMEGETGNYFFEPDYRIEVLGDTDAIEAKWDGAIGCEYETVKAVSPGVAVLRFTYDPLALYGAPQQPHTRKDENGETIKKEDGSDMIFYTILRSEDVTIDRTLRYAYFNSIDPRDTGIVVVHVPSAAELAASEDVKLDTGITLLEFDTNYFDNDASDHAEYTFTPTAEASAEINVRMHKPIHIRNDGTQIAWGYGWSAADYSDGTVTKNDDGSFTVKLYEGRNVIEVSAGGVRKYHVANARGLDISIGNGTSPGEPLTVGDTAEIRFSGLKPIIAKMAGIYNPGRVEMTYRRSDGGGVVSGDYGQYVSSRPEHRYLNAELTGEELTLMDGSIEGSHMGASAGAHRLLPLEEGVNPYKDAPTLEGNYRSTMPDITIKAASPALLTPPEPPVSEDEIPPQHNG
jgi:hypothetical protein